MKIYWFISLFFLISSAHAQTKLVKLDEDAFSLGPCEPSITLNPNNPSELVASSVLNRIYYSKNGGKSWKKKKLKSSLGVWGDPCVVANYKNRFFFFHLSDPEDKGWDSEKLLDRMVCQYSDDGGKSWSDGVGVGYRDDRHDQDKEWAAVNAGNNEIYLTWTEFDKYESTAPNDSTYILFAKSTDSGETWSEPIRVNQLAGNCLDDDLTVEGAVPAVGPNGQIYVAWAFDQKIYIDRSKDGGKTWLPEDKVVAEQPGGWSFDIPGVSRSNGLPVTACDTSKSDYHGTVYVNWTDQRNGEDDTDVWIAKSTDQGNTWSEPIRINDDEPGKQQFLTWMAIDPLTGFLYVVFYDRRAYADTQTDVYVAYSTDGGKTFANRKITEEPFVTHDGPFFGDYNNIVAYDGKIHPVWTQMEGMKTSVWTTVIRHEELVAKKP